MTGAPTSWAPGFDGPALTCSADSVTNFGPHVHRALELVSCQGIARSPKVDSESVNDAPAAQSRSVNYSLVRGYSLGLVGSIEAVVHFTPFPGHLTICEGEASEYSGNFARHIRD